VPDRAGREPTDPVGEHGEGERRERRAGHFTPPASLFQGTRGVPPPAIHSRKREAVPRISARRLPLHPCATVATRMGLGVAGPAVLNCWTLNRKLGWTVCAASISTRLCGLCSCANALAPDWFSANPGLRYRQRDKDRCRDFRNGQNCHTQVYAGYDFKVLAGLAMPLFREIIRFSADDLSACSESACQAPSGPYDPTTHMRDFRRHTQVGLTVRPLCTPASCRSG
jgi:hypothetical protein